MRTSFFFCSPAYPKPKMSDDTAASIRSLAETISRLEAAQKKANSHLALLTEQNEDIVSAVKQIVQPLERLQKLITIVDGNKINRPALTLGPAHDSSQVSPKPTFSDKLISAPKRQGNPSRQPPRRPNAERNKIRTANANVDAPALRVTFDHSPPESYFTSVPDLVSNYLRHADDPHCHVKVIRLKSIFYAARISLKHLTGGEESNPFLSLSKLTFPSQAQFVSAFTGPLTDELKSFLVDIANNETSIFSYVGSAYNEPTPNQTRSQQPAPSNPDPSDPPSLSPSPSPASTQPPPSHVPTQAAPAAVANPSSGLDPHELLKDPAFRAVILDALRKDMAGGADTRIRDPTPYPVNNHEPVHRTRGSSRTASQPSSSTPSPVNPNTAAPATGPGGIKQ